MLRYAVVKTPAGAFASLLRRRTPVDDVQRAEECWWAVETGLNVRCTSKWFDERSGNPPRRARHDHPRTGLGERMKHDIERRRALRPAVRQQLPDLAVAQCGQALEHVLEVDVRIVRVWLGRLSLAD